MPQHASKYYEISEIRYFIEVC